MATRSKSKRAGAGNKRSGAAKDGRSKKRKPGLRALGEPFREWRFEAQVGGGQYIAMVLLSVGTVAVGAAAYGAFLSANPEGPARYAAYIFAAGALLLAVGLMLNQPNTKAMRVGIFGVGFEQDGRANRMRWYEMDEVGFSHQALQLSGKGKPLTLPLAHHGPAIRRIVVEASERIPDRVELDDAARTAIGTPLPDDGARVPAEPPQMTSERCFASDEALTFEEDVRVCANCAVPYHKTHAPRSCQACGRKLSR